MGRKKILEGGTRDKIINAAMVLFFKNGYESTSVRMILEKVGGEIGMFYHYFKSKDELFHEVVERFFINYQTQFFAMTKNCTNRDQFISIFGDYVEKGTDDFGKISDNLHWTIRYAFVAKTIESLQPAFAAMLGNWNYTNKLQSDLLASQLLFAISGTIHSSYYRKESKEKKKIIIRDLINRLLDN